MTTAELTCAGWSAAELLTLQERLAGLLADQCRRYAAGDSSLPRETAAELLCSLRYVLGLEGRERPADPRPLLREPLEEAFRPFLQRGLYCPAPDREPLPDRYAGRHRSLQAPV